MNSTVEAIKAKNLDTMRSVNQMLKDDSAHNFQGGSLKP